MTISASLIHRRPEDGRTGGEVPLAQRALASLHHSIGPHLRATPIATAGPVRCLSTLDHGRAGQSRAGGRA